MKRVLFNRVVQGMCVCCTLSSPSAMAGESLFGFLKGAEPLPQGSTELVQHATHRYDKGEGKYDALNTKTEIEYGLTDRTTVAGYLLGQAIDTSGLVIDGYLPKDESSGLRASGVEASISHNFLSPAGDDFGLSTYFSTSWSWLDPHSGQKKDKLTFELELLLQKYFLDGELIWVGNGGMESTLAQRHEIADLPAGVEWNSKPEMEIGFNIGTGLSWRFAPNWFIGGEVYYESEFETEVGKERSSVQAGPSLHYANQSWWTTLSYLPQIQGDGFERIPGQTDTNLHLIEKTKYEVQLKVGFEF